MSTDPSTGTATALEPVRTRRVVLGFDGSTPARAALDVAVREARSLHVPLLLLCAVEAGDVRSVQAFSAVAEQMLAEIAAAVSNEPGVTVTTALRFGSAAAALVEGSRPGDLLVVGTHGHRPVARVLLGSTSTSVVTHARQPVLVVRSSPLAPEAPVVVGVDGSTSSTAAVRAAAAEADRAGCVLQAVIAVPSSVDVLGFTTAPDAEEMDEAELFVSEALAGLREQYPDLVVEHAIGRSHPVEALVRASRRARLLVLGSRGRGTFRSVLLGSVSREVVQRAETSVLVVPAPDAPVAPHRVPAAVAAA